MKLELTEHDIFLLKLAGSELIAFLAIRFLVMPGLSRLQESTLRKEELEQTVSGMQAAIDSIPDLEQQTGERLAVLKEASAPYYQRMENRQVDELLTGLALKYGLFPVSLDIEGAQPSIPEPYLYSVTGSAGQAAGQGNPAAADSALAGSGASDLEAELEAGLGSELSAEPGTDWTYGAGAVAQGYMQTAVGRMVLRGDEEKLLGFIDEVESEYPALRLRVLRRDDRLYFDAEWNAVEQPDMSCEMAIYMYDWSVVEEKLEDDIVIGGAGL